nr:pentatricopeptide repeat-containing protein At1g59720, chloroplastic/mitochondrial-like [Ipomoea batatas]
MQKCGVDFDETTLVMTLSACSEMSALDYERWLHFLVDNSSLSRTLQVSNLLIDVYAKCGEVEEAHRIYEALKLFSKILNEKQCFPNDVTFLGALCACSHGGMVEGGKRTYPTIIGWTVELARKRLREENKSGGFGKCKVIPRIEKPVAAAATSGQNVNTPVTAEPTVTVPQSSVDRVAQGNLHCSCGCPCRSI